MQELNLQEIEEISGGLSRIQNVGLGLFLGAGAAAVGAVVFAPITVVAGGFAIISAGLGALGGAAFALPAGSVKPNPPMIN